MKLYGLGEYTIGDEWSYAFKDDEEIQNLINSRIAPNYQRIQQEFDQLIQLQAKEEKQHN